MSDPRKLLVALDEAEIISPQMDAGAHMSILASLESLEAAGWRFIPPKNQRT